MIPFFWQSGSMPVPSGRGMGEIAFCVSTLGPDIHPWGTQLNLPSSGTIQQGGTCPFFLHQNTPFGFDFLKTLFSVCKSILQI